MTGTPGGPSARPGGRADAHSSDDVRTPDDAQLAEGLRQAHRRLAALDADDAAKARAVQRLLAISDAAKHDTTRAARRLDRFLADLDRARPRSEGAPPQDA